MSEEMVKWRPIETAPKDGSEFIVQLPAMEARAFWSEDMGCWILSSPIHIERPSQASAWRRGGTHEVVPWEGGRPSCNAYLCGAGWCICELSE